MRPRSLFAAFRGEDGRSLARALVVLMLASLFAGGLDAGASAATRNVVMCAVDGGDFDGDTPAPHVSTDCCILGLSPFAVALDAAPPEATSPPAPAIIGARLAAIAVPAGLFDGPTRARDPPFST